MEFDPRKIAQGEYSKRMSAVREAAEIALEFASRQRAEEVARRELEVKRKVLQPAISAIVRKMGVETAEVLSEYRVKPNLMVVQSIGNFFRQGTSRFFWPLLITQKKIDTQSTFMGEDVTTSRYEGSGLGLSREGSILAIYNGGYVPDNTHFNIKGVASDDEIVPNQDINENLTNPLEQRILTTWNARFSSLIAKSINPTS